MTKPTVLFIGSFLEYSVQILDKLHLSDMVEVIGVVTTPPRPAGRKQNLTKTQVHVYADQHNIPVFTPDKLNADALTNLANKLISQPDLFVVAGYGKLLPLSWLEFPTIAPINIHFSLLPKYRGAMPGEWAILMDEKESGISLIEMSTRLDAGNIYAQASYQLEQTDTRESVYAHLYDLGAMVFLETIGKYIAFKQGRGPASEDSIGQPITQSSNSHINLLIPPRPQPDKTDEIYARLLNKDDSFIPWELVLLAMNGQSAHIDKLTPFMQDLPAKILTQSGLAEAIERMIRGLYGWPGVWTKVATEKGNKRLKLHSASVTAGKLRLDQVQLEGETHTEFSNLTHKITSLI